MTAEAVLEQHLLCSDAEGCDFQPFCAMGEHPCPPLLYTAPLLPAEFVRFCLISNFDTDFSRCILCLCKRTISGAQAC